MTKAFIGLGSNLGDREGFLNRALRELDTLPGSELVQVSSLYDTDPVGDPTQPHYLNLVVLLTTDLPADQLLWNLQRIEGRLGRPHTGRLEPRVIDLDLLFYGDAVIDTPELQVPHPRYAERPFVLVPLAELEPGWTDPRTGIRMDHLLRRRPEDSVRWAGRIKL
jgi:2-amino-4-hydroxy-6-hydroxymethyldihydropteridine diphosphokinase